MSSKFRFTELVGALQCVLIIVGGSNLGCGGSIDESDTRGGGPPAADGGGPAADCALFEDRTNGSHGVTIRIVNHANVDLYLGSPAGGCEGYLALEFTGPEGPVLWHHDELCSDLCRESSCEGCVLGCEALRPTLIRPGGFYERAWSGTFFREVVRPVACGQNAECEGEPCLVEEAPASGPYQLALQAWPELVCDDTVCLVGGQPISSSASWSGEDEIEIVFQ